MAIFKIDNGTPVPMSGSSVAKGLGFDNSKSGITATNVQDAIDEILENGTGGGGINLSDVSGATATASKRTITIKWTDPTDIVIDNVTLASWAGTRVVRKAGSAPANKNDGTVVVDSKVRNQYSSTGFVDDDSTLQYDTTYYYRFFPYTTGNATTDGSSVNVTPERISVALPVQSNALTYNGETLTATFTNYDSTKMTVSGDSAINAGTHTATFSLLDGYCWATDNSITDKTVDYTIARKEITTVPSQSGTLMYTGSKRTVSWDNYNSNELTLSGITSATAIGTYTATFTPTSNFKWSDSSGTSAKNVTWEIVEARLTVPTVTGSFTYDGTSKSATIGTYDSTFITMSGTTSATDAGTYTVTFTLNDTTNYKWDEDDTTAPKSVTWSIAKAQGSFTLSKNSVTLDSDSSTDSVTITVVGDGLISITNSDSTITTATLSQDKRTISFSSPTEKSGTATITVSLASSANYEAAVDQTITVTGAYSQIYGVYWDGTSTSAWTRTDAAENFTDPIPAVNNGTGSSPFDNISPWKDMVVSDNSAAGKVVAIPKFYYKWIRSGATMKLQISMTQEEGFLVSPAHMDRGDGKGERDVVYVGRYHCATSTYKSTTGVKPAANITRSSFRTSIHNLGSTIWQWDYATLWTIQMLYLVEFANWNSQAKIGYGCGNNSSTENMGSTDGMQYHTGTSAANRTTYNVGVQYRNIEGLWSNVLDWCDGIYFSSANVYCIKNPSSFSDITGGTLVGTRATSGGYISGYTTPSATGFEWALYPNAVSGSDSTYVCDYCSYSASGVVLSVGGYYSQSQYLGLFCLHGAGAASSKAANIGSRLLVLP